MFIKMYVRINFVYKVHTNQKPKNLGEMNVFATEMWWRCSKGTDLIGGADM